MSNVFEHYEADYLSSTRTAAQNIEKLPDLLPGHEKAELTAATDRAIDAAEDIVKQMELEARSLQGEERQTAVAQAKDYKASIAALKEQLKQAKLSNRAEEAARAQLFQQANPAHLAEAETQRSRLLAANSKMSKASDQLRAACQIAGEHRTLPARLCAGLPRSGLRRGVRQGAHFHAHIPRAAVETEQVGADILTDLDSHRQTIQGARNRRAEPRPPPGLAPRHCPPPSALGHRPAPRPVTRTLDRLAGANTNLDRSKKLLSGMARRARNNKVSHHPSDPTTLLIPPVPPPLPPPRAADHGLHHHRARHPDRRHSIHELLLHQARALASLAPRAPCATPSAATPSAATPSAAAAARRAPANVTPGSETAGGASLGRAGR